MTEPSESTYLRRRAQLSRKAAHDTANISARSSHTRLAAAYDERARMADVAEVPIATVA